MSEEKKREEAITGLKRLRNEFSGYKPNEEMFDMAIKALEQEPCDDMVSRGVFEQVTWERDVAIEQLKELGYGFGEKPKTGRWVIAEDRTDWYDITYECSCCKRAIIVPYDARNEVYKDYPYCHCGAKMVEPQESEGNNG